MRKSDLSTISRFIVINTGPLITLERINAIDIIGKLPFDSICPEEVREEILTILQLIPANQFYNMTDLFDQLIRNRLRSVSFPIREYWLDIGQIKDYERANGDCCKKGGV